MDFARRLLPAAEAALGWIDRYGDADGDGFVEYLCRSPRGIRNQGWKDSHYSIVHADGRLAEPPIALAEVQAYVYLAKQRMADVYRALARPEDAHRLEDEADLLKVRFNEAFWMEDERYFARRSMPTAAGPHQMSNRATACTAASPTHKAAPLAAMLAPDMSPRRACAL
jgi:glycogen debranching enzyme